MIRDRFVRCFGPAPRVAWVLATIALAGCATGREAVWRSREQYVRIEPQDTTPAGVASLANDHPVRLGVNALFGALEGLRVRMSGATDPRAVFTETSARILSEQLSEALRRAGPGEDAVFAMVGLYPILGGLGKTPLATTGRVFFRQGRLNVLFGQVREPFRSDLDRRGAPLVPGARVRQAAPRWSLQPGPGVEPIVDEGGPRPDWVALRLEEAPTGERAPGGLGVAVPGAVAPEPGTAVRGLPPSGEGGADPSFGQRRLADRLEGIEGRLRVLEALRQEGLLSDEEYLRKRREILDDL